MIASTTAPQTTSLVRRALMQLAMDKVDEQFFTPDARARIPAKLIRDSLNAFSLPVAIIHSSELVERRTEKNLRVYRYLLTDIGRSLSCTVKLTSDDKIAALEVAEL